jgi:hypothetical protein
MTVSVLERMARRLAADERPQSRREMLVGADRRPAPAPEAEAARQRTHRPPASGADKQVMRTALAHVAPTRDGMLTLVEALRDPTSAGTFTAHANKTIRAVRADLASAHQRVSAISTHSTLRANVLAFLADVDAIMATLQSVGKSTDPARAARLQSRARTLKRRVTSLEHEISPALAIHRRKR